MTKTTADILAMVDTDEALSFLALLGKDPAHTYFRTIRHGVGANKSRSGRDLLGFDAAALTVDNAAGDAIYVVIGNATEASGQSGAVRDVDITSCPALFVEWDDIPKAEQLVAWQELHLLEPTVILDSGGKSIHCYWRLTEPITPEQWRKATAQLIAHCNSDRSCCNPSRVMRLPGFRYWDKKTGKPTGSSAALLHTSTNSYTLEELLDCLIKKNAVAETCPFRPRQSTQHPRERTYPSRPIEEVKEALQWIPAILPGTKQRDTFLRLAWGLLGAVREAGESDAMALALLEEHSPLVGDAAEYLKTEPNKITANTFWRMARDHGWRPRGPVNEESTDPTDGFEVNEGNNDNGAQAGTTRTLTVEQIAERLTEAHRQGIGGTELELLITELSAASDLHPLRLNAISNAAAAEVAREIEADREAARMAAEADRQEIAGAITLASILPPSIAEAIRTRCAAMPYSELLLLVTFITAMAGLTKTGTTVNGNAATRFVVPTNLFTAAVGNSGQKKTPLITAMITEPLEQIRLELAQAHTRAMAQWREECRGQKKDERPPEPRPAHAVVNDYTGEALAGLLQEHDSRGLAVLVLRDELSGLFGSMNAYRAGRGADEQMLLELFDGGGYTGLRVKGDRFYSRSHVAIFGNIQPAILSALVGGYDSSGKWARFLFVNLPQIVAELPTEVSPEQEQQISAAVQHLQTIAKAVYTLPPAEYKLAPAAVAHFSQYEAEQQQQGLTAELDTVRSLHGKAAGKVLRVAGLLHILKRASDPAMPEPHTITVCTLRDAITLVEVLNQWAAGFHADAASEAVGGIDNMMRRVHNASALHRQRWIGWRDFSRSLSRRQTGTVTRQAFEEVIHRLAGDDRHTTDISRHSRHKEPEQGCQWGEIRRGERGAIQYRAIRPPL